MTSMNEGPSLRMWDFAGHEADTALIDEAGNTIKYSELKEQSNSIAACIGGRCIAFLLCRNSVGSVMGYVGFLNNGIVPVMLSGSLDSGLLCRLIEAYRPPYIWLPKERQDRFPDYRIQYEAFGYALLKTGFATDIPIFPELALLLTTSGSTGSPKFVRQSYFNIRSNTESIIEYLALDHSERPITTLPMNYTYGLSIINTHLAVGACILLTDKTLMRKEFWQFFKEQKATSFGGVPYTYEMLDKLRFCRMDLPSLRTMTQAGGKLTPEFHEKYALYAKEKGKKFVVMYGQCEATARMGYLPADKAVEKKGAMGIAIPGGRFHLINAEGQEILEPNVTGELVYDGPNVTLGYCERAEDLCLGDERHGILETGDMAQFDEDGFYYIVGRKKRFLKIYGNRVNLDEIERLVKTAFPDTDFACAGVDDHMYLFVTDESVSEEVKKFVVLKTGLNQMAFKVIKIDEIPKNDAGKILYLKLEKYYK